MLHLATFEYLLALCAARSVVGGPQALVDEARQRLALAADHGGDIDRTILRPRTGEGLALNPDVPFGSEPAPPEELASDRSDVKDSANALLTALSDSSQSARPLRQQQGPQVAAPTPAARGRSRMSPSTQTSHTRPRTRAPVDCERGRTPDRDDSRGALAMIKGEQGSNTVLPGALKVGCS